MLGPRYEALREEYVAELRDAVRDVGTWWASLVDAALLQRGGNKIAAAEDLRRRWPVGAAAHPRILAVVRKYYLACDALNREIQSAQNGKIEEVLPYSIDRGAKEEAMPPDLPISPGVLVGESLFTRDTQDLARVVGALTYWPIGVDVHGRYV